MTKWWVWFFGIATLLIVFFCYLLYFVWGGKVYFDVRKSISRLTDDKRSFAEGTFNSKGDYSYSGILMRSIKFWPKGIWVWGAKGPRFFRSDEYTVYSYFQMCTPENLESLTKGGSIKPKQSIDTDIKLWSDKVKTGNFITLQRATPENGGNLGRLREAWAYDWWVFNSSMPIDKQCEK